MTQRQPSAEAVALLHKIRTTDGQAKFVYSDQGMIGLLDAFAARSRWRPIETAPKDGVTIIVGRDMDIWGFVRGTGRWISERGIEGWVCRGFTDPPGELGLADPTHWQPLPESPEPPSCQ